MTLDLMTALEPRSNGPIKILLDGDSFNKVKSPINHHVHHHDELVGRTEQELRRHKTIMNRAPPERGAAVRDWFDNVISRLKVET
jgi:hypothetical protein